MSVSTMSLVFNAEIPDLKYNKKGKERTAKASTVTLVLLAYADHANDNGEGAYPGYERLMKKTKLSAQGLADTIEALKQNKILILKGRSKSNTNSYSIDLDKLKAFLKPLEKQDSSHLRNVSQATRVKPSVKPLIKPSLKDGANAPIKANQIPQVILFRKVTSKYPSKASQFTVITSVDKVSDRLGQEVSVDDLLPFYREWCDRGYNPVSVKWLEWAVSGDIPRHGGKTPKSIKPKETPEQLEKRKALARQLVEQNNANI